MEMSLLNPKKVNYQTERKSDAILGWIPNFGSYWRLLDLPGWEKICLFRLFLLTMRFNANQALFDTVSDFEGMTYRELFTAFYPQDDEMKLPGHNARAVSEIVNQYLQSQDIKNPKVASVASGAGIFQKMSGLSVTN